MLILQYQFDSKERDIGSHLLLLSTLDPVAAWTNLHVNINWPRSYILNIQCCANIVVTERKDILKNNANSSWDLLTSTTKNITHSDI